MKPFHFLFSFALIVTLLVFATACKKEPVIYVLQGQVADGTARSAIPGVRMHVVFEPHAGILIPNNAEYRDLGWATTDSNGHFRFEYERIKGSGDLLLLSGDLPEMSFDEYRNENADFMIYRSSLGTLRLQMNTDTLLGTSDTLFVAFREFNPVNVTYDIDTFLNLPAGFQLERRVPPFSYQVLWARGAKNMVQNSNGSFVQNGKLKFDFFEVRGDPFIDEYVLNY
jgi:hypothetical protein